MRALLFLLIISVTFRLTADPGNAYRYKATFVLADSKEVTGYFFLTTYQNQFDNNESTFTDYILSNYHFPIELYSKIKTVQINKSLTVDFALDSSEVVINKHEISRIELIEEIETEVGSRLRLLTEKQYSLLENAFLNFESLYKESYSENCVFYILNWKKSNNLAEIKNEINQKIIDFQLNNDYPKFLKDIDKMKDDLVGREIILFNYCSAL